MYKVVPCVYFGQMKNSYKYDRGTMRAYKEFDSSFELASHEHMQMQTPRSSLVSVAAGSDERWDQRSAVHTVNSVDGSGLTTDALAAATH